MVVTRPTLLGRATHYRESWLSIKVQMSDTLTLYVYVHCRMVLCSLLGINVPPSSCCIELCVAQTDTIRQYNYIRRTHQHNYIHSCHVYVTMHHAPCYCTMYAAILHFMIICNLKISTNYWFVFVWSPVRSCRSHMLE